MQSSTTPLSFEAPAPRRTPASIRIYLIFPQTRVTSVHLYRCIYGSIFIQICAVVSKRRIFSAPESTRVRFGRSRSSKVDDFSTNRKRVCDFLLVGHCDYGRILHRFWDTATYWLKITYFFLTHSYSVPLLPSFTMEFCTEVNHQETTVMGLSSGEDHMIVAEVVLTQCQRVTDRRTDGRIYSRLPWTWISIDISMDMFMCGYET